jgi:hypothetical protein
MKSKIKSPEVPTIHRFSFSFFLCVTEKIGEKLFLVEREKEKEKARTIARGRSRLTCCLSVRKMMLIQQQFGIRALSIVGRIVEREKNPRGKRKQKTRKSFIIKLSNFIFSNALAGWNTKFPLLHAYEVAEVGTRLTFALGQELDEAIE